MRNLSELKDENDWREWVKSEEFRDALKESLAADQENFRDRGVLYSGFDGFNRAQAEHWADAHSGITIEQTSAGVMLESANLEKTFDKKFSGEIWTEASRQYASTLSGDVKAFVMEADKSDVFFQTELPELLKNENVTSINGVPKEELIAIRDNLDEVHRRLDNGLSEITQGKETQFYERETIEGWSYYQRIDVTERGVEFEELVVNETVEYYEQSKEQRQAEDQQIKEHLEQSSKVTIEEFIEEKINENFLEAGEVDVNLDDVWPKKKDEFTVEIDGKEQVVKFSEKEGVIEVEGVESEEELERLMKENPKLAEAIEELRENEELVIEIEEEKEIEQEREQVKLPEKEQEPAEIPTDRDRDRNR